MRNSRLSDWLAKDWRERAFRIYYILFLCYIFLPLAVLVLYAFNASEYLTWPLKGLTFHWFQKAFDDSKLILALKNSVIIGLVTTFFSTLIGGGLAYGLVRFRFRGKTLLEALNILVIITYGVVSAVSVLLWFRFPGIPGGIWLTILGHTTFIMPFAVMVIRDRLLNFDLEMEEAAMDLGATRLRTFRDVTLPLIIPSVIAAALFCFTISLGEFLLAFFLIGHELTLPVYIYSLMRFTFTPAVNAAAVLIISFPTLAVIVATVFFRHEVEGMY
jgi:spermidine/putrescine transport system permease protein